MGRTRKQRQVRHQCFFADVAVFVVEVVQPAGDGLTDESGKDESKFGQEPKRTVVHGLVRSRIW